MAQSTIANVNKLTRQHVTALICALALGAPVFAQASDDLAGERAVITELEQGALASIQPPSRWRDERRQYRRAMTKLAAGETSEFERIQATLRDYPLAPYLEYHRLRTRLAYLDINEIEQFDRQWSDTPLPARLKRSWLLTMARRGNWDTYLAHYEESSSAERQCYHLRALYRSGERTQALNQVAPLWLAGKSQPKACDPLFDAWIGAGYLTEELVWQRLGLALEAGQQSLARYLLRFFESNRSERAQLYYDSHRQPTLLATTSRFAEDNPDMRQIVAHALTRLASRDAAKALRLWSYYADRLDFSETAIAKVDSSLWPALIKAGHPPATVAGIHPDALAGVANEAVESANWSLAISAIDALPLEERLAPNWQYWLARSLRETQGVDSKRAQLTLNALAEQRHYYGFMAADALGRPGRLNSASSSAHGDAVAGLLAKPSVVRAIELYEVGERTNARREWNNVLAPLTTAELQVAGHLALQLGWTDKAIRAANKAGAHDDLALRFPMPHLDSYLDASVRSNVPLAMLLGVTRQESAFDHRARSSANARGLMQMLHSTARIAARRAKLKSPSVTDLYQPETNITLAASHLNFLMDRYDGQRPLVFAAYNAGEHRVDRWIKEAAGAPMDLWIERIPFYETRNYVKNVLAFNYVYGKLSQRELPVLFEHERRVSQPGNLSASR
ncbi:MAG: transglycosylase SLT domain-containing protein [Pseudomonadaceae bacterium]|nr:transglycosylase SLT domain-containing protein [Pseudomonadaceae bacterium]